MPAQSQGRSMGRSIENAQTAAVPAFHCESGKTHCSHMRSYEEASFYLRHCPNVSMDGDGDGIPCEQQFGR